MVNCPNCGVLVEKDSKFCQECGTKIDNSDSNTQTDVSSDYEKNKRYALIGIGYLTVLILLISVLSAWYNVKVINADRLLLYPLLSIMMSVYVSLKLISDEKTFKHGVIIPVISFILFIHITSGFFCAALSQRSSCVLGTYTLTITPLFQVPSLR